MNNNKNTALSWGEPERVQPTSPKLAQVEGILTSAIQLKELRNGDTYYWAFFALEDQEAEIPVIFRLFGNFHPGISPQSKVLLKGSWAEPENSDRPSFTCQEYQILVGPPQPTIKDLRAQIDSLISTSLEKQSEWKQRVDYLFKKKKDLEEIDKLTKLGGEYLQAYLLLRQAYYSNYQDNLLSHTTELKDFDHYLTKISQEIEEVAQHIRAYQSKA